MSKAYTAYKYRLYPNKEQTELIEKTFYCVRKIYNLMLEDAKKNYELTGKFDIPYPSKYKNQEEYAWLNLKEVDSQSLNNARIDLQTAFKNCFSKSRKKKNGFPKFKSAKFDRKSYTTCNLIKANNVAIESDKIKLPKLGLVKIKNSREIEEGYIIKAATVSKDSEGRYFVSVRLQYEKEDIDYSLNKDNVLGLDYSSPNLYVDQYGNKGSYKKYYNDSQKQLAKLQRRLSRKKGSLKGEKKSNNYLKQLKKVNKLQCHIANQRLDHLHKLSTNIANNYDVVCTEDLNMKAMGNKKRHLGKATNDNGYGMFLDMLDYKLDDRSKYLVKVDKFYPSSQLCHVCGYKNPIVKDQKVRKYTCPVCGTFHDRDINAAINIRNEGLRILEEEILT